jgi:hypothetical protein
MKYVDWGYAIAFGVLFLYVVSLFVRRRRLERAVAIAEQDRAEQDRAEQDRAEQDRAEQDRAAPHGRPAGPDDQPRDVASQVVGVPDGADRDGRA